MKKPILRPEVRGNQMMIDKVYAFADEANKPKQSNPVDKRAEAQAKRERKMAKRRVQP